jgi:hypothetical protein
MIKAVVNVVVITILMSTYVIKTVIFVIKTE